MLSGFSCDWLFVAPWTVAHQAPLSVGFSRQEYWSGLHALLRGILPTQGSNPRLLHLPHWQGDSLPLVPPGMPYNSICKVLYFQNVLGEEGHWAQGSMGCRDGFPISETVPRLQSLNGSISGMQEIII